MGSITRDHSRPHWLWFVCLSNHKSWSLFEQIFESSLWMSVLDVCFINHKETCESLVTEYNLCSMDSNTTFKHHVWLHLCLYQKVTCDPTGVWKTSESDSVVDIVYAKKSRWTTRALHSSITTPNPTSSLTVTQVLFSSMSSVLHIDYMTSCINAFVPNQMIPGDQCESDYTMIIRCI